MRRLRKFHRLCCRGRKHFGTRRRSAARTQGPALQQRPEIPWPPIADGEPCLDAVPGTDTRSGPTTAILRNTSNRRGEPWPPPAGLPARKQGSGPPSLAPDPVRRTVGLGRRPRDQSEISNLAPDWRPPFHSDTTKKPLVDRLIIGRNDCRRSSPDSSPDRSPSRPFSFPAAGMDRSRRRWSSTRPAPGRSPRRPVPPLPPRPASRYGSRVRRPAALWRSWRPRSGTRRPMSSSSPAKSPPRRSRRADASTRTARRTRRPRPPTSTIPKGTTTSPDRRRSGSPCPLPSTRRGWIGAIFSTAPFRAGRSCPRRASPDRPPTSCWPTSRIIP